MVRQKGSTGLSPAQVEFYNSCGFVRVENVLTPEQLDGAHRAVDELVEQSRTVTSNNEVYVLESGHSAEAPHLARIKHPSKQHPFFEELSRCDAILDCVEALIGGDIRFQGEKLNMKMALMGSPVEWHQDFVFYPHTNDDLLAVGVALDDCTLDNGCLLVIPGSHRGPLLDHHQDGYFVGAITPSRGEVDLSEPMPVELKAGDISIHHVRTLHSSAPNRSAEMRRLLLYQYAAADAWPLRGVPDLDAFDQTIVRGEPTMHARMVDLTVPMSGRSRDAGGGDIFGIQTHVREKT